MACSVSPFCRADFGYSVAWHAPSVPCYCPCPSWPLILPCPSYLHPGDATATARANVPPVVLHHIPTAKPSLPLLPTQRFRAQPDTPPNLISITSHLRLSARGGSACALYELAQLIHNGTVPAHEAGSFWKGEATGLVTLYMEAARGGCTPAAVTLAEAALNGAMGVEKDACTAARLLKALAEAPRGDEEPTLGEEELRRATLVGDRGEQSHAVWLYAEAALQGIVAAQVQLAMLAERIADEGGPQSAAWQTTAEWAWRAAASQGDMEAANWQARMLSVGQQGASADHREARRLWCYVACFAHAPHVLAQAEQGLASLGYDRGPSQLTAAGCNATSGGCTPHNPLAVQEQPQQVKQETPQEPDHKPELQEAPPVLQDVSALGLSIDNQAPSQHESEAQPQYTPQHKVPAASTAASASPDGWGFWPLMFFFVSLFLAAWAPVIYLALQGSSLQQWQAWAAKQAGTMSVRSVAASIGAVAQAQASSGAAWATGRIRWAGWALAWALLALYAHPI